MRTAPRTCDRRPVSLRMRGAVACALLLPFLAGCSGVVEIDSPDVDATTEASCRDFLDALPSKLSGQESVEVSPDDALGRAWGDPAIVVTCGVDMPDDFNKFSACWETDGVGWYAPDEQVEDARADVTLTTIDYSPIVRIELPGVHRPPDGVTVDVGAAVKKTLEKTGKPCV